MTSWSEAARGRRRVTAAALVCLLTSSGCSPSAVEALDVLRDISAGHRPSTLKETTPQPVRTPLVYRRSGKVYLADLYRPGGAARPKAGIVLVPGVAPKGRDDPRLVAFANSLARVNFEVLVPDIPNLRALRVRPGDTRHIADAIGYLAERGRAAGAYRTVGLSAVSYAVGPAVLAALEPDVRDRIDFLLGIGGYYELAAVIRFFTTGSYREGPGEAWRRGTPDRRAKWVFARANAFHLRGRRDRRTLTAIARAKARNPDADVRALARRLGPEGRAILNLLTNRDPARVGPLIARLPRSMRADFAGLDPSRRNLSVLKARLILVHGRDDKVIPFTESRRLAAAAPPGKARLYLADSLSHVDLGPLGIFDILTLWDATQALIEERDR